MALIPFHVVVRAFHGFDEAVMRRLPEPVRRALWAQAFKAKSRLFPSATRRDFDPDTLKAEPPTPRKGPTEAPGWLLREIEDLRREVDADLPAPAAVGPSPWHGHHPGRLRAGPAYRRVQADWPQAPTHVLVVPWLKKGGGDLVAIEFATLLASIPGNRVLVVSTEPQDSPWARRLPAEVRFLDLGHLSREMRDEEVVAILSRLLLQEPPLVVHVFPSRIGWKLLAAHGRALGQASKLFASSFCEDGYDAYGCPYGYADTYLGDAYTHLTAVLSDSEAHPRRLCERYGFPASLFRVVRVPTAKPAGGPAFQAGTRRVLWAGRLDGQKRPELLAEIAAAMPDVAFEVYGSSLLQHGSAAMRALARARNVTMHGPYDGFDGIVGEPFGAYLYTSRWDGVPNVLLEAGARGMAVVASEVGGVGELVTENTGWPVSGEAAAYVKALSACLSDRSEADRRAETLRALVAARHGKDGFVNALAEVPGYLEPSFAERSAA